MADLHYDDEALLRYRYETMEAEEAEEVASHLRTCTECMTRFAELGRKLDLMRDAYDAEADLPEGLADRVLEQVQSLQHEQEAARVRAEAEAEAREAEAATREAEAARAAAARLAGEPATATIVDTPAGELPPPAQKPSDAEQPERLGLWAWLGLAAGGSLRAVRLAATLASLAGVIYVAGGLLYHSGREVKLDTRVSGEDSLIPGSRGTLLVLVVDRLASQPVANADVRVNLRGPDAKQVWKLFEGKTNGRGLADPTFNLPDVEDGDYRLEVVTRGAGEDDRVVHPIRFRRAYKVHLSTDKPLYQPGQTIHIRSLVLQRPTLTPPEGKKVTLEAVDPKGNRILHEQVSLSKFGVGAHGLELADDIRLGEYRVRAIINGDKSETKVKVARYALPKFKIKVKPDKPFYLAGETLRAAVDTRYFFGKPVARGEVRVVLFRPDGAVLGEEIKGKTDREGSYSLTAELPASLAAGGKPETVLMEVAVKDAAGQEERKQQGVTVTRELLQMEVVPEGGRLVVGMENTLYVLTTSPDGQPLAAKVDVTIGDGKVVRVRTHDNGLGSFRFTPTLPRHRLLRLLLRGEDREGRKGSRTLTLDSSYGKVLVATEKAFYRPGDTVRVGIQAVSQFNSAVVEGLQEGQTVFRTRVPLEGGKGQASLDLPQGITGTLRLDVQAVDRYDVRSSVVSRRVVVAEQHGLTVKMSADHPTFRPGSQATLRFKVTGPDGGPKAAAIGLYVVDESVFALAASRPALARAFFLLERSLMEARHNLSAPETLSRTSWGPAEQAAGRLLLSLGGDSARPPRFVEETFAVKSAGVQASRAQFEENAQLVGLGVGLILLLVLVVAASRRLPAWAGGMLLAIAAGVALMIPINMVYVLGGLVVAVLLGLLVHHQAQGRFGWAMIVVPVLGLGAVWFLTATPKEKASDYVTASKEQPDVAAQARTESTPDPATATPAGEPLAGAKLEAARPAPPAMRRARRKSGLRLALEPEEAKEDRGGRGLAKTFGGVAGVGNREARAIPRRAVRVRRYFPETMYVHPELVTDEQGVASLTLPVADSITEWRVSALASSADGKLGAMNRPLKVFQDFFVDLDMPVALVRGDEVTIPVAVYNYLTEPQTVRLELKKEPWFEAIGPARMAVKLGPGGVDGRDLRVRVLEAGRHRLTMRADGTKLSDALAREILVSEAGQERSDSASGTLLAGETVRVTVQVPDAAVKGSAKLVAKLFPSQLSSALDGLEGSLRMPHGCFEQTSSATYPNVLIYDYLKRAKKLTPRFEKRARRYIGLGYQRLLTFEVPGGGFEWFGRAPANQILTAYGLMEFRDMSRVFPVDEKVIQRTQQWLIRRQGGDGSWSPDPRSISDGLWRTGFNGRLMVTAYIAWSLAESGYTGPALGKALGFLLANRERVKDPYTLSLVTAAMARAKKTAAAGTADRLAQLARRSGKLVHFNPAYATAYYGRGRAGAVETTALAAYALGQLGHSPKVAAGAVSYLAENRDHRGTWHSTQGTILALRALLQGGPGDRDQSVTLRVNGEEGGSYKLEAGSDRAVLVELGNKVRQGVNVIELSAVRRGGRGERTNGQARTTFQVVATYTLPWRDKDAEEDRPLVLKVSYDRTKVNLGGIVPVEVQLTYRRPEPSGMVLLSLGLPAGLTPLPSDLKALTSAGTVARHERAGDRLNLYIDRVANGGTLRFKLRLKAINKVRTQGVGSLAYLYYSPEVRATAAPQMIVIN